MVLTIQQQLDKTLQDGRNMREEYDACNSSARTAHDFDYVREVKEELEALRAKYKKLLRMQRATSH
jgi:hypothetical protein